MKDKDELVEKLKEIAGYFADAKLHEFEQTLNLAIQRMESINFAIDTLEAQRDYYRSRVVWAYTENGDPVFYQGTTGENEINDPVSAEFLNRTWLTIKGIQNILSYYESRNR